MRILVTTIALCLASVAGAQEATPRPDCSATTPALPPELAGWSSSAPATAAASDSAAARASLSVGQAAQLRLMPTTAVRYALPPEKPGTPTSHGGLASFAVAKPGTYRVALGAGAWIDVVRDGKALASVAHGHGPTCSGVRKMVDFKLMPGRYLLQVAGNADPVIPVMIAALR